MAAVAMWGGKFADLPHEDDDTRAEGSKRVVPSVKQAFAAAAAASCSGGPDGDESPNDLFSTSRYRMSFVATGEDLTPEPFAISSSAIHASRASRSFGSPSSIPFPIQAPSFALRTATTQQSLASTSSNFAAAATAGSLTRSMAIYGAAAVIILSIFAFAMLMLVKPESPATLDASPSTQSTAAAPPITAPAEPPPPVLIVAAEESPVPAAPQATTAGAKKSPRRPWKRTAPKSITTKTSARLPTSVPANPYDR